MGSVLRRLLFFFQRKQFDRDLEEELRFHEEMKAHALADADGMSGDEARAAARRRLGNPLRLREQSRDPWVFATVETFAKDARHALRLLRRDPAFTFTALATLALGIGLTTTIFSVAYGVLWRPLPYPDPDRLVIVSSAQQTETRPQDVLELGARVVRGAAPARHHVRSSRGLRLDRRAAHRTRRAAAGARARRESELLHHAGRHSRARPRVPHRRRGARRRSQRDRQRPAVAHDARGRSGDRRAVHHHRRPPPHRRRRAAAGLQLQAGDPDRRAAGTGRLPAQSLARRHRQRARSSSCWAA